MKCPNCGKEVELQKRQVGLDDNGEPILNEFAICRDCKKKWNLDKQRKKKGAQKAGGNSPEKPAPKGAPKAAPRAASKEASKAAPRGSAAPAGERRKAPAAGGPKTAPQRTGNIPPEPVRKRREASVKQGYKEMVSTGERRTGGPKAAPKSEPVYEQFYEPVARFSVFRLLLGIVSLLGGLYYVFRAVMAALDHISSGGTVNTATAFGVVGGALVLSGLITWLARHRTSRLSYLFPFLLTAVGAAFAFLSRQEDPWLFYGAIACIVLVVLYLILTILGAEKYDEERDFDYTAEDEAYDEKGYDDEYDDAYDDEFDDR